MNFFFSLPHSSSDVSSFPYFFGQSVRIVAVRYKEVAHSRYTAVQTIQHLANLSSSQ